MDATQKTLAARVCGRKDPGIWAEFAELYGEVLRQYGLGCGLPAREAGKVAEAGLGVLAREMRQPGFDASPTGFKQRVAELARDALGEAASGFGQATASSRAGSAAPGEPARLDSRVRRGAGTCAR